jgi:hypothetical protein
MTTSQLIIKIFPQQFQLKMILVFDEMRIIIFVRIHVFMYSRLDVYMCVRIVIFT